MSSSGVRHGRKNPFFEKNQKEAPRRPPLGKFVQKIKELGQEVKKRQPISRDPLN